MSPQYTHDLLAHTIIDSFERVLAAINTVRSQSTHSHHIHNTLFFLNTYYTRRLLALSCCGHLAPQSHKRSRFPYARSCLVPVHR